jgi:signal transduction histidine kinase
VKNARKFTPPDGKIVVESYDRDEGRVVVRVRDNGAGIHPDVLPRIFDAFEQGGREVTRKHGGLGLGLAISKTLVELHGGTLTAHSDGLGHGAMFTIELPVIEEALAASDAPTENEAPATAAC